MSQQLEQTLPILYQKLELLNDSFMETGISSYTDFNTKRLYQQIKDLPTILSEDEEREAKQAQTITNLNSHFDKAKEQTIRKHLIDNCFVFKGISLEKSTQKISKIKEIRDRSFTIIKSKTQSFQPISEQEMNQKIKNQQIVEILYTYGKEYHPTEEIQLTALQQNRINQKFLCLPSTDKKSTNSLEINTPKGQQILYLGKGRGYTFQKMTKKQKSNTTVKTQHNIFNCLDSTFNTEQIRWQASICGDNQIIASKIRSNRWY